MTTLKELSERTGYAPATISRILSGDPTLLVTQEARRKVLEEAGRSNYIANRSRRGRTPKNVLRIGLAEKLTPAQQLEDPYYLYLASFLKQSCMDKKYACVPLERHGETFVGRPEDRLDGIIAIGVFSGPQIDSLAAISPCIVFVDSSPLEERFDSVVLGFELGISLALEHLLDKGHRQIGFIGPSFNLNERHCRAPEIRRTHFIRLMKERGLLREELLLECEMAMQSTHAAVTDFLRGGTVLPTAFICANEESAVGALTALKENGLRVPEDISIVSFNDTPKSVLVEPALTSVSTHVEEMSRTALRMLSERVSISGNDPIRTIPLKVIVPPSLAVRASSGPARQA